MAPRAKGPIKCGKRNRHLLNYVSQYILEYIPVSYDKYRVVYEVS
jgi:hypothetical protein